MTKSDELDDSMRVLSTGTCETLTGSSKLNYHIGIMPDGEIYLRVHGQHGRRILLSGVDLAAGHPDGPEEAAAR